MPAYGLRRVASWLGNEAIAQREIERVDSGRRAFIKRYFAADLCSPTHYDLVVNTDHIGGSAIASLVVQAVRSSGYRRECAVA